MNATLEIRRRLLRNLEPKIRAMQTLTETDEDKDRRHFLKRLDSSHVPIPHWETQFVRDHLASPRPFTNAQRAAIDAMRDQYASQLSHQEPL